MLLCSLLVLCITVFPEALSREIPPPSAKSRLVNGKIRGPRKSLSLPRPKLLLYYNEESSSKYELRDAAYILENKVFNKTKKTVIYTHGYLEGASAESVKTVVRAYIERGDHNIIVLDWHRGATPTYFYNAVPNMKKVGRKASKAVLSMIKAGLNIDTLHLVGHSLGAQMSGIIGRKLQMLSNGDLMIKRITALDPAYPGFYDSTIAKPISAGDAEFVDVIHTDAGIYGSPYNTGTVDFWPNGGDTNQPGCSSILLPAIDICSHARSWRFWAESVSGKYNDKFHAVKAKSWSNFKKGYFEDFDSSVVMGIDASPRLTGAYYLETNSETPFAKGEAGATYDNDTIANKLFSWFS